MMSITSKKYVVSIYLIFESHIRYNNYRDSLRDDIRISRSLTHTTLADVIAVKSTMDSDRRHTIVVLCENLDMSYCTVTLIIIEELTMSLVYAH